MQPDPVQVPNRADELDGVFAVGDDVTLRGSTYGHPLDGDNVRIVRGHQRICKPCQHLWNKGNRLASFV